MTTAAHDESLYATLCEIAAAMEAARHPWWIIGSAAMRLFGADVSVADVDILLSVHDARSMMLAWSIAPVPEAGSKRFRSSIFARYTRLPLPVEFMAGFDVRVGTGWRRERPRSRIGHLAGNTLVYTPSVGELIGMCHRFGRDKDMHRIGALRLLTKSTK